MLKILARCELKPGTLEKAGALYKELVEKTRQEKGCIEYGFFVDLEDASKACFVETWESAEALDAHVKSEHFTRIFPQLGELGASMGEVSRMQEFK